MIKPIYKLGTIANRLNPGASPRDLLKKSIIHEDGKIRSELHSIIQSMVDSGMQEGTIWLCLAKDERFEKYRDNFWNYIQDCVIKKQNAGFDARKMLTEFKAFLDEQLASGKSKEEIIQEIYGHSEFMPYAKYLEKYTNKYKAREQNVNQTTEKGMEK